MEGLPISLRRNFFATADDLLPGFDRFEAAVPSRYVRMGGHASRDVCEFRSGRELPHLGSAPSGGTAREPAYLVLARSTSLVLRDGPGGVGCAIAYVDQMLNPDSTVLCLGGIHGGSVLVAGEIASLAATPSAVALHKLMVRNLTRGFRRVRGFWLGPSALARFEAGARLTQDVRSPSDYDLRLESAQ